MLLSYRNLTVSFGGPTLLDDAGLTIAKRERICLLGRNGEGKSTLLRILSGEIQPDTGEIEAIVDAVIERGAAQAEQYRSGNEKIIGWFVGQVMKETQGKANPQAVNELLRKKLQS